MEPRKIKTVSGKLKLLIVLPVIIAMLIAYPSCAGKKKVMKTQTDISVSQPKPSQVAPPIGQKEGDAYVSVDEMPVFPGGDGALLKYIAENTVYPKQAKDNNLQGRVITRFKVKEDGTVSDVSILKGVDPQLDNEAIRVIGSISGFTPGKLKGVAVPVWYMVPISFTLKGDIPQRPSRFEVIGSDTVYSYTNEVPRFPGGSDALRKFKTENVKYPSKLKSLGIEGVVFVRFYIEKNGSVSNIRILQGVSPTLDAEAMRVTGLMPRWEPGKDNGKPVKFVNTMTIEFLLIQPTPPAYEEGTPYVVVEEMPMFPGGDSTLLAYISQNTKYPENAKANNIGGRVIIRFCVTDVGGIDRVSVLKGVDPELDAEAVRVVKTIPRFKPGKQGGKPVNVWYMVPITFGLVKPAAQTAPPNAPPPPAGYDQAPVYSGGEKAMYKFINSKLNYPETAKEKHISGKAIVRFAISTDGSVNEVVVTKGIDPELDAEAARVIKLLPKWKPATLAGAPVKVWYTANVVFKID